MVVLILSSRCILNWERIKVSDTLHVSVGVELISNSGSALHLDEIEWATNWGMHILELPFSCLLLALRLLAAGASAGHHGTSWARAQWKLERQLDRGRGAAARRKRRCGK